jgi:hypothetical protein
LVVHISAKIVTKPPDIRDMLDVTGKPEPPAQVSSPTPPCDIWSSDIRLYGTLFSWACAEEPDSLVRAFRQLCRYARFYTSMRRFRTWSTDFRRKDEAHALRVLSQLDVDAFFRRWPLSSPKGGGDDGELTAEPQPRS